MKLKWFSLPNLLANKSLVPELLQAEVTVDNILPLVKERLFEDQSALNQAFTDIHLALKQDASEQAAKAVIRSNRIVKARVIMPAVKKIIEPFEYPIAYCIAGVDEVGRGPLVGDVVTAAVILDPDNPIEGLMDSKKLSDKKRQLLSVEIKATCYCLVNRTSIARRNRHP